jgi:hypothetical protein
MTTAEEWTADDELPVESIADRAMTLAAHAVTLATFWKGIGPTSAGEYTDVLVAAYELGDPEQFASVLCEVSTSDQGSALEIAKAFTERVIATKTSPPQ